jgi:hypothetical protein
LRPLVARRGAAIRACADGLPYEDLMN